MQTDMHITPWTDTDPGGEVVGSEYYIFTLMTKLLVAMISTTILAVVYIVLQGLWLSIASGEVESSSDESTQQNSNTHLEKFLENWSRKIYGAVFLSGPYLFLWTLMTMLGVITVLLEKALAPGSRRQFL